MKKIVILFIVGTLVMFSCKKYPNPSTQLLASFPQITITSNQYYSIPIGGTIPTVSGTAYDSIYGTKGGGSGSLPVTIDESNVDSTTPGLYAVVLSATNFKGYISYKSVYIGVTGASPSLNLSGWYVRNSTPTESAYFTKLGTGLFMTSNVGGDDTITQASSIVQAVFVVTSDSTIDFGSQLTSAGTLTAINQMLSLAVGDTSVSYALSLTGFGTEVRSFVKQ